MLHKRESVSCGQKQLKITNSDNPGGDQFAKLKINDSTIFLIR